MEQDLKSVEIDGSRYYITPGGLVVPSVTTVLGDSRKEFFSKWRQDPRNKEKSERAAARGTSLHSVAETYIKTGSSPPSISPLEKNLLAQIKSPLSRVSEVVFQEKALWSDTLKVAGRVDLGASFDGVPSIIDFKTCSKVLEEQYITHYFQQASLYSLMCLELGIYKPKNIVIISTPSDLGGAQVFVKSVWEHAKSAIVVVNNYWKKHKNELLEVQTKIER